MEEKSRGRRTQGIHRAKSLAQEGWSVPAAIRVIDGKRAQQEKPSFKAPPAREVIYSES